jgi:hypothetical protein
MADGGIIEGALIGAALGGGSAAIQGTDPLKGALMGAATGGIGGGIFGGAGSAAAEAGGAAGGAGAGAAPIVDGTVMGGSAAGVPYGAGAGGAGAFSAQTPTGLAAVPGDVGAVVPPSPTNPFTAQSPTGLNVLPGEAGTAAAPQAPGSFINRFKALPTSEKLLYGGAAGIGSLMMTAPKYGVPKQEKYSGPLSKFRYDPGNFTPRTYAEGGIAGLNQGPLDRNQGPIMVGGPSSNMQKMASGGSTLGGYSDGGRLLKGPGDGMSDNIPARIGRKQPARLAEGEFVVPADVVSHLGNGSTDAGAKQLYAMMNKVRHARTGNPHQGKQINPRKYMPA